MVTKIVLRSVSIVLIMLTSFIFYSCTKTADGNLPKELSAEGDNNLEATNVQDKDYNESDDDLTSVSYMEFYEQLAPYGEWIQVKPEDIGMKSQTLQNELNGSSGKINTGTMELQKAFATSYENNDMVYVWKPSSALSVMNVNGSSPSYVPYSNGKWVNTNSGWYFKANTPAEETTSHYGRWVNKSETGWLWIPGRVWAPAWVDWKENDQYVSWAPLPPSVYMSNGTVSTPVIENSNYLIVEKKYFVEPDIYKYNNNYYQNGEQINLNDFKNLSGLILVDNLLVNKGPDLTLIQTLYGKNIEYVSIQTVNRYSEVKYTGNEFFIYKPGFKRYKSKDHKKFNVNQPKSFKNYGDWNEIKSDGNESKNYEKQLKNNEKDYRKIEKDIRKSDDGNMYDKNNDKNNKSNDKKNKNNGNNDKNKGNKNNK